MWKRAKKNSYLAASLTHVGLLASVNTLMNGQGRTLNELLAAVWVIANMRADAAVDTFCRCQCAAF